jgi:hypothetical protein
VCTCFGFCGVSSQQHVTSFSSFYARHEEDDNVDNAKADKDAKDKGDIRGWFCAKVPRGRPKKDVNEEIDEKSQSDTRTILVDKLPEEGGDDYNKWWSTDGNVLLAQGCSD